jgi:peptidoglycan/LPS O-acetylase OafA/YrhL
MYSESQRVEYLDSIRGLAALFVLLSHTFEAFAWPATYYAVSDWPFLLILFEGRPAVCMFFVLSGYVLSKPYVVSTGNAPPRKIFLPTFYLRRLTRIWLPWFFFFVVSIFARRFWFCQPLTDPPITPWLNQYWHVPMTTGDFFRQCVFLQHDGTHQLLPQDWSLNVELKASLLIPLFIFLLRGKRKVLLALLAVAFLIPAGTGENYISFIIGVLLARYGDGFAARLLQMRWFGKALLLVLGLTLYQTSVLLRPFHADTPLLHKTGWIAGSFGCALVLVSAFGSPLLQKWLSGKPAIFLGRISYSVYLLQLMVVLCLLPPLVRLANEWGVVNRPALLALTMLASVGVTVGCAALTYRFVELPAINLGHLLTKKMQCHFQK